MKVARFFQSLVRFLAGAPDDLDLTWYFEYYGRIYPFDLKWDKNGIEWGRCAAMPNRYFYYFFVSLNAKEDRFWGRDDIWYDGPHASFGFWYFMFSWSTHWTVSPDATWKWEYGLFPSLLLWHISNL